MRGNPEGTSMYRPETARIVRAALRVFAPPACRASTGLKSKIKSDCFPCIPALESTQPKRKRPGFPGRHQDLTTRQSPGQTQNVQPMAPKLASSPSVVLTQGAAAIKGQKLSVDLKSGTGRMEGGVTTTFVPGGN